MKNYLLLSVVGLGILFSINSCQKIENEQTTNDTTPIEDLKIQDGFDFSTTKELEIKITAINSAGQPLAHVPVEVMEADFVELSGEYINEKVLFKAFTNEIGQVEGKISIASSLEELVVGTDYIGLPHRVSVSIKENLFLTLGGQRNPGLKATAESFNVQTSSYNTLGNWNSYGFPFYLEQYPDTIDSDFLADINASLPEGINLETSHPMYFGNDLDYGIYLEDSADVWVTFVHEGAGWQNALGFYYYNENDPPVHQDSITNKTIIFPNVSYVGSGGALLAGDKVYLGAFSAGTVIQWFLVAQGWSGNGWGATVGNGVYTHYSQHEFNIENSSSLRQHNVFLYDEEREILLLAFEDVDRENSFCDHDFNDAVFYATVNPITSVVIDNLPPVDTPDDSDNDGVSDTFDDYPNDPDRAYDIFIPSDETFGTLAFEDLWPEMGDYDFNDLVIDYQYQFVANADNEIVELFPRYVLHATGATYQNGFGVEFDISSSAVSSVSGGSFTEGLFSFSSNGTESGQSNAVIMVFDNAYSVLGYPGNGLGINTTPGATYVQPDTIVQYIGIGSVVSLSDFGTAPYNPFIVLNQNRGMEVHLINKKPTDLANLSILGTQSDASSIVNGVYYKTSTGLPWGINLPESFDYPSEKNAVNSAYLKFNDWAQSAGVLYPDWYQDISGYRNEALIY